VSRQVLLDNCMENVTPLLALFLALSGPLPSYQAERNRFPPQHVCVEAIKFNEAYQAHCRAKLAGAISVRDQEFYCAALAEASNLKAAWTYITIMPNEVDRAREDPEGFWRIWWFRLRERIGEENYAGGSMPPTVPVWRWGW